MSASVNQLYGYTPDEGPQEVVGYTGDLDDLHAKQVLWFEEAELSSTDERELSERDRNYYDHKQWTTDEENALNARGQPVITINKIHDKVELLCGLERRARTDPKAFPRTPTEEERAEAATQALRYVDDYNNYPVIRSAVFQNMLIEGVGAVELGLADDGKGGADVTITHVSWERLWRDPHSRAIDFSDARYKGVVVWMDRDQAEEMYPDATDVIADSFASRTGSYDDRPSVAWTDNQRSRVRVVQCHWTERGVWWSCTFTRNGLLTDPERSRFKDARGASACSLVMQSAYVDRENNRYGAVRGWISLQDEINKRRSKSLHLLSVHQAIAEQGAVQDVDKARRELAKPDGYIEITPGLKFEVLPGGEMARGQFELLQHATAEMQLSGPNASMSGTDPRELSGRAILAQQAGGAVQNEPLADSLRMFSRRVYEMAWMAVREHWTGGKWVRVTDQLNDTRWVGINRPVTLQDELAGMPEHQRAMAMQRMQLVPGDPRLTQVIRVENDITDLDVDISIEEGANLPTLEAENFQTLVQLAGMQPGLIPGDVLIAASSLRNKSDLLARMKAHMEAQQKQQQEAAPLVRANAEAEVRGKQAKASADEALAQERKVASARGIHDIQAEYTAPPYGAPHMAADGPSSTGKAAPMVPHASGGLITRVMPEETFHSRLPGTYTDLLGQNQVRRVAPNFRAFGDPLSDTRDNMELDYRSFGHPPMSGTGGYAMPPQDWAGPPRSHAAGGPINTLMSGPDPAGPDDGYITAKAGEYVLNQGAVARYGQPLLDALNAGNIDPKILAVAVERTAADIRAINAKAASEEAKAAHERHKIAQTVAQTQKTHREMRQPPKQGA